MNMKLLSCAAFAACVSAGFADSVAWFNGGLGGDTASGGSWNTAEGATLSEGTYTLDCVEEALKFTATESKGITSLTNYTVSTSAKFGSNYDEFPAIPADAKGGVIAYNDCYYVVAKDDEGTTNTWTATSVAADFDTAIAIDITISNDT